MKRKTIAAHIPAYNCPDLLLKCVSNLMWVDEIIIADNSTNNEIRNLAKQITHSNVKYIYSEQPDIRLRLLDMRDMMKSDYVLWVCTDEYYTQEGAAEIIKKLSNEEELHDGYIVNAKTYHYGKFDEDGPNHVRLFRRDMYYFELKSMHDQPKVDGSIGVITNPYHHFQLQRVSAQANKIFFYSDNDSRIMNNASLELIRTDTLSPFRIKIHYLSQILRMCWRTRGILFKREVTHIDLWKNYEQIITVIAMDSVPTEEIISREANVGKPSQIVSISPSTTNLKVVSNI